MDIRNFFKSKTIEKGSGGGVSGGRVSGGRVSGGSGKKENIIDKVKNIKKTIFRYL